MEKLIYIILWYLIGSLGGLIAAKLVFKNSFTPTKKKIVLFTFFGVLGPIAPLYIFLSLLLPPNKNHPLYLYELLNREEKARKCKLGYVKACYRDGGGYYGDDYWYGYEDGLMIDLLCDFYNENPDELTYELLHDLMTMGLGFNEKSCCDSYYLVKANKNI